MIVWRKEIIPLTNLVLCSAIFLSALLFTCERFEPLPLLIVSTDTITNTSPDSLFLEGTIIHMGEGIITQHGFCWSETENPTLALASKSQLGIRTNAGMLYDTISGIKPFTKYYVKAYAIDKDGTIYGEERSFTTDTISTDYTCYPNLPEPILAFEGAGVDQWGRNEYYLTVTNYSLFPDELFAPAPHLPPCGINDNSSRSWVTIYGNDDGQLYSNCIYNSASDLRKLRFAIDSTEVPPQAVYIEIIDRACNINYQSDMIQIPQGTFPTVTTSQISTITETSAIGGGEVIDDGGTPVTARGVCWSTSWNPTISENKTTDESGIGSFISNLRNLDCGTYYYVRAYATNAVGTAYGDIMHLTTLDCTVTDFDGNVYSTVDIGDQRWMAENLKVTHFATGAEIPLITSNSDWGVLEFDEKAYCYYWYNDQYGESLGALYTWAAAMNGEPSSDQNPSNVQGVCPDGWHLPSNSEWKQLEMFLGMSKEEADYFFGYRGSDEGGKLKDPMGNWNDPNVGATNESGFTAISVGLNYGTTWVIMGSSARYWSATEYLSNQAFSRHLTNEKAQVSLSASPMNWGISVRCVKDPG